MSPRRADPSVRPALVDVGARLLAEEGPKALSARRVASEVGCSTMAVYTHFGGMSGLVREMVHVGFTRLKDCLGRVADTGDPVADTALLGRAYRHNGLENPHLYAVMFGASSLASFSLSENDRQHGRYTLAGVARCAERCIGAGRFQDDDPMLVANQMWIAVHGMVALELGGYLVEPYDADQCFETQLTGLMISAGDDREAAERSVRVSRERFAREVEEPLRVP
ncbi:TetR/AcrR family transcriptional regulator [Actinomadura oligospora]|uniref:TetR/AcrR family transcriptional regulator n=1 Tax=Actinomadura oligospora TaxID=111804 RepID=UPI000557DA12|nr:TetR/AcrR family transcriptional regulator [Actinomadura oligospora]